MPDKRKDSKGRILKEGERQRSDGRYEYRYTDAGGSVRSIYSWRLVETDPTPSGKRKSKPLRELETTILIDLNDGIDGYSANTTTLNEAYEDFFATKVKLKESSRIHYQSVYNHHARDVIGIKPVGDIKPSHIRKLYIDMQVKDGLKFSTVKGLNMLLHQIFEMLVDDDILRKNPTKGLLRDLDINQSAKRHALSRAEQDRFLTFIASDTCAQRWIPLITFLFGTGARIGEATAITWEDIDFDQKEIHIRKAHTTALTEYGTTCRKLGPTKTIASARTIPMFQDVYRILKAEYNIQFLQAGRHSIQSNFVFKSRCGNPVNVTSFWLALRSMCDRCNAAEEKLAAQESRSPIVVPYFSPHIIRHTFCTRMCEEEPNLKVVQEIMGHANFQITMDVYNEATKDAKRLSFESLEGKFKVTAGL